MNKYIKLVLGLLVLVIVIGLSIFSFQEKLIFKPTKLTNQYTYQFDQDFEEMRFPIGKNEFLHGILFTSKAAKNGVILYFHGNRGQLNEIGKGATLYTEQGYDILYINYRGYGLSSGSITSEKQLFADAQIVYDALAKRYTESKITLAGISIGTGIATYLAANNQPKNLILIAPYSSLKNLLQEKINWLPSFIWKYPIATNHFLSEVKCPITILHGEADKMIPFHHAQQLKDTYTKINLVPMKGFGHTNFLTEKVFANAMRVALNNHTNQ